MNIKKAGTHGVLCGYHLSITHTLRIPKLTFTSMWSKIIGPTSDIDPGHIQSCVEQITLSDLFCDHY